MPSYYQNPYAMTPTYGQAYAAPQQQSFTPVQQPIPGAIIGVDGEAAARAYQMPAGIQPGTPIALWDTNEQVIYLKSVNQMGMPNPITKLKFEFVTPQAQSGNTGEYATKADLERLKKEILEGVKGNAEPAV